MPLQSSLKDAIIVQAQSLPQPGKACPAVLAIVRADPCMLLCPPLLPNTRVQSRYLNGYICKRGGKIHLCDTPPATALVLVSTRRAAAWFERY